ncbi:hypothetical protein [Vibrio sp. YIC-376]|uniref:hypothetical protein n=1 Tax=Vibrio sp. YIC-376 TaxID=3136162 RepID=UPI00402A697B
MKLKNWVKTGVLSLGLLSSSLVTANANPDDIALQMYTLRDVGTLEEQFAMASWHGMKYCQLHRKNTFNGML